MTRVSPSLIVALLERRVKEFGPITHQNKAEVTAWLMKECQALPDQPDRKTVQAGDR